MHMPPSIWSQCQESFGKQAYRTGTNEPERSPTDAEQQVLQCWMITTAGLQAMPKNVHMLRSSNNLHVAQQSW